MSHPQFSSFPPCCPAVSSCVVSGGRDNFRHGLAEARDTHRYAGFADLFEDRKAVGPELGYGNFLHRFYCMPSSMTNGQCIVVGKERDQWVRSGGHDFESCRNRRIELTARLEAVPSRILRGAVPVLVRQPAKGRALAVPGMGPGRILSVRMNRDIPGL
jgi:hypothetical protein